MTMGKKASLKITMKISNFPISIFYRVNFVKRVVFSEENKFYVI